MISAIARTMCLIYTMQRAHSPLGSVPSQKRVYHRNFFCQVLTFLACMVDFDHDDEAHDERDQDSGGSMETDEPDAVPTVQGYVVRTIGGDHG